MLVENEVVKGNGGDELAKGNRIEGGFGKPYHTRASARYECGAPSSETRELSFTSHHKRDMTI